MRITFHGAARTVTGSRHLLEANGHRILLDCGLYQGNRREMAKRNGDFGFDASAVDAVVLSHAHADHCGMLPGLVKKGFRGAIHATPATVDLARHIMLDSAKIQHYDAKYENRRRKKRGGDPVSPLYTTADAEAARELFVAHDQGGSFEVAPGVMARFRPAGHILGAAVVVLDIVENGRRLRLGFSGDLGRYDIPLLRDPSVLADLDYLILESTYGDRRHAPPEEAYADLAGVAAGCCGLGGRLLIPSFALGRAQDLIYCFHRMRDAGEMGRVPVYLDSPLAVRLSEVFRRHSDAFDEETRRFMTQDPHGSPLDYPEVHYVSSVDESKALNNREGAMIIISSSGMLTGGRILHHLRKAVGDPRNTVLFVSWQAPGTLGRRLIEGENRVRLFGQEHDVKAKVRVVNGFSAHADSQGLLAFAAAVQPAMKGVFLVHGEVSAAYALADGLIARGLENIAIPEMHEAFDL
ncbi:MAG: MBL fold metallo-hydrolase RNA specificity domain-containing protein [Anaerolineae bacterium]